MPRIVLVLVVLAIGVTGWTSASQQTFEVIGARPGAGMPGDAVILGRVVDGSDEKPLSGAIVTLTPVVTRTAGARSGAAPAPQTIISGIDGAFVFRNLPPGQYMLRATVAGYADGLTPMPGLTVTLPEGERIRDVEIPLRRTGVITGQVVDESNEGVEGIMVHLMGVTTVGVPRTTALVQSMVTDDRGVYRSMPMAPGEYVLCALFSRHATPLVGGSSGSGYRVGDFALMSGSGSRNVDPAPDESGRQLVFADTCYPATSSPAAAQLVRVEGGQERSQINLLLRLVQGARIYGTLSGPDGRVQHQEVHLNPVTTDDSVSIAFLDAAHADVDRDGHFAFIGVPAGSYVASVAAGQDREDRIPRQPGPLRPVDNAASTTLIASAPVIVGDADVTGLALTLREAARVGGQVLFDGSTPRSSSPQSGNPVISLLHVDRQHAFIGDLAQDGRFVVMNVVPGQYIVRMNPAPVGWSLKAVFLDGHDMSDRPIDVGSADIGDVVITLTDRPSRISGVVRDETGATDTRALVVVFPADHSKWTRYVEDRRAASSLVSARSGFDFGLPAGEYVVAAVSNRISMDWADRHLIDAITQMATRVSLRDGDRQSVTLTSRAVR